jgi:hypothetical protein
VRWSSESENQSNEKRGGLPPIDAPEEGPSLAARLSGMIRALVSGGKAKTQRERGPKSQQKSWGQP